MNIQKILSPARTLCHGQATTKKSLLELTSKLLLQNSNTSLTYADILTKLVERERLGSTGIGHGVAIPHARLDSINTSIAALIHLDTPIDFNSADDKPIDLIFAFLVPEHLAAEHLELISTLATCFNEKSFRQRLRSAKTNDELFQTMIHQQECIK